MTIALLGVLAPMMISLSSYAGYFDLTVQSILWYFHLETFGSGFQFIPFYVLFSTFPLLLLRMVPVLMIVRYYHGKTTRRRALVGVMVGDILFLAEGLLILIFSYSFIPSMLFVPLPFQMLVGFLILWRFPILEPTRPWESSNEKGPWWEKESNDSTVSSDAKDNENRVW